MRKSKYLALLTAMALVIMPVSVQAAGTTTTTTTTTTTDPGSTTTNPGGTTTTDPGSTTTNPGGTTTNPGGTTTNPGGGTTTDPGNTTTPGGTDTPGTVCPPQEDGGQTPPSPPAPSTPPAPPAPPADNGGTPTNGGATPQTHFTFSFGFDNHGKGNDNHGDNNWSQWTDWTKWMNNGNNNNNNHDGQHEDGGDKKHNDGKGHKSDNCNQDNGKGKDWAQKIQNLLKYIDELKKAADSLQGQLDRLMQLAKSQGSTSDTDALKQIQDALGEKDKAGQADSTDLAVLAEAQDKLGTTDAAVQTLEKALAKDYTNDTLYQELIKKHVKKGDKGIKVYVKGQKPAFDVQPTIVNGRTLVPVRAIGESLQADVQFDPATSTITMTGKNGKVVILKLESANATVDGQPVTLDVPAQIVGNRTVVPLRALGDMFGLQVQWDSSASMAVLK